MDAPDSKTEDGTSTTKAPVPKAVAVPKPPIPSINSFGSFDRATAAPHFPACYLAVC